MYCWVLSVAMCFVRSFRWQCVLFGISRGKLSVGSFSWQCVFMGLLGGNVCCSVF